MRLDAFDTDLLQGCGNQDTARKVNHVRQLLVVSQLVNRWPVHHSADRHLWADRRDQDSVPRLKSLGVRAGTSYQYLVQIHFADQMITAKMLQSAKRTTVCRAPCRV